MILKGVRIFSDNGAVRAQKNNYMGLEQVRLPGIVIADLYKKVLVEPSPAASQDVAPAALTKPLRYYGENLSNMTILVNTPAHRDIPEEYLSFLVKVLASCHLTLADAAIINMATEKTDFHSLRAALKPKCLLLFGNYPYLLPDSTEFTYFAVNSIDGVNVVSIPDLDRLMQHNEESKQFKIKLWANLKQLFNV